MNAFANESIGTLCSDFLKFFEGLYPTFSAGDSFDFKKLTIQEVTLVGTYCYTNKDFQKTLEILKEKKIGDLGWIEYRDLKKGSEAFQEIHNGTCVAPKIILIP